MITRLDKVENLKHLHNLCKQLLAIHCSQLALNYLAVSYIAIAYISIILYNIILHLTKPNTIYLPLLVALLIFPLLGGFTG